MYASSAWQEGSNTHGCPKRALITRRALGVCLNVGENLKQTTSGNTGSAVDIGERTDIRDELDAPI